MEKKDENEYNSDASTDIEDDIATQLFEDSGNSGKLPIKSAGATKNSDCDDDIFNQATQVFSETECVKGKGGASTSYQTKDADNTQDILDAFGDDDMKTSESAGKDDYDDDIPTQLFLDDEADAVFKKPQTLAPKNKRTSGVLKSDKNDDLFDEGIFDAATQPYTDHVKNTSTDPGDEDLFEAETQLYSDDMQQKETGNAKKDVRKFVNGSDDEDTDDCPTQLFESPKQKTRKVDMDDEDEDVDDFFNQPTQPFISAKDKEADFFDAPTQLFEDSPVHVNKNLKNVGGDNVGASRSSDFPDDSEDLPPTQLFDPHNSAAKIDKDMGERGTPSINCFNLRTPSRGFDITDDVLTPTQVYNPNDIAAKTPKRLSSDDDEDLLSPTQPFNPARTPKGVAKLLSSDDLTPTQPYKPPCSSTETPGNIDDDMLAPTQVYTSPTRNTCQNQVEDTDDLPPTQLYTHNGSSSDPSVPSLVKDSTKSFTPQRGSRSPLKVEDIDDLAPTQPYCSDAQKKGGNDWEDGSKKIDVPSQVDPDEAPTQPYSAVSAVENDGNNKCSRGVMRASKPPSLMKNAWDDIDADATQEIDIDREVGIDETQPLRIGSPRKSGNMKESVECGNDSDADSEASETLLNEGSFVDEEDEGKSKEDAGGSGSPKELQIEEENYHSDESTDMEDNEEKVSNVAKVSESEKLSCVTKITDNNSQSPRKLEEKKGSMELDGDSDADSDASETLLSEERNEQSNEEMIEKRKSTSIGENEKAKESHGEEMNYLSDESTDMEDNEENPPEKKVAKVNDVPQSNSIPASTGKLCQKEMPNVLESVPDTVTDSVKGGNTTFCSKENANAKGVLESEQAKIKEATPGTSHSEKFRQELFSQDYPDTEDLLGIDVQFGDSEDYTDSTGTESSKNLKGAGDLKVNLTHNEDIMDFTSSDNDSEAGERHDSPKLFDLTPCTKLPSGSKMRKSSLKKSAGKAKRKFDSKDVSEDSSDFSGFGESPNKKSRSSAAEVHRNKPEEGITKPQSSDSNKKSELPITDENKAGFSGIQTSPSKLQKSPEGEKVDVKITGDSDKCSIGLKTETRTRKRTLSPRKLFTDSDGENEDSSKVQKLELEKIELVDRSPKVAKSVDKQDGSSKVSLKSSRTSSRGNVKAERHSTRQKESSNDTSRRESVLSESKEIEISNVRSTRTSNRRNSTSSTVSNQSHESDSSYSEKRSKTRSAASRGEGPQKDSNKRGRKSKADKSLVQDNKREAEEIKTVPSQDDLHITTEEVPGDLQNRSRRKTEGLKGKESSPEKVSATGRERKKDSNASNDLQSAESASGIRGGSERKNIRNSSNEVSELVSTENIKGSSEENNKNVEQTNVFSEMSEGDLEKTKLCRGQKKKDSSDVVETKSTRRSAMSKKVTEIKEREGTKTGESTSQVRVSGRTRREPKRFSPERDSVSPLHTKKDEKEAIDDNIQETKGRKSRTVMESQDTQNSEEFVLPTRRKPMPKLRIESDSEDSQPNTSDLTVPTVSQPQTRRTRASIATSRPSSQETAPKSKARLSTIPEKSCVKIGNTKKDEKETSSVSTVYSSDDNTQKRRGKKSQTIIESQDTQNSEEFVLPIRRKPMPKLRIESDSEDSQPNASKQSQTRKTRASIATSQPSSQETAPKSKTRLSTIPEKSCVEIKKRGSRHSKAGKTVPCKGKAQQNTSKRMPNSPLVHTEDSDKETKPTSSSDPSDKDSEDSQDSGRTRRSLPVGKQPSTPKLNTSKNNKQVCTAFMLLLQENDYNYSHNEAM